VLTADWFTPSGDLPRREALIRCGKASKSSSFDVDSSSLEEGGYGGILFGYSETFRLRWQPNAFGKSFLCETGVAVEPFTISAQPNRHCFDQFIEPYV
jgi:hypothetical protein